MRFVKSPWKEIDGVCVCVGGVMKRKAPSVEVAVESRTGVPREGMARVEPRDGKDLMF